ncbi:1895_t:CDS:2, partial [Rhizophagus irregularis]
MMVLESSNNDVCLFKSWDKLGLFDGYDDDEFNQWCKFHSYNDMAHKKYDMDHRFMRVGSVSFLNENEEFEVETINPCARLTIARAHGQIDDLIDGAASKQMCV